MTIDNYIEHGTQVAKGASYLFFQGVAGRVASFLFLAIASRLLSISNIGAVSALGVIGTLFITIGTLAIPSAATKYISEYLGKNEQSTARGVCRKTLQSGLSVSVMSSFVCFASSAIISQLFIGDLSFQSVIAVLALDVGALTFQSFLSGILWGVQRFRVMAFVGTTVSVIKLLSSLFFLLIGLDLLGVIMGWVIADLIGVFISLFFVPSSFEKTRSLHDFPFSELIRFSLPLYGASIVVYLSTTIDKLVILSLSNLEVLGVYSIAIAAVNAIGIVSTSLGGSLFPKLTQIQSQYGENALKYATAKASKYVFLINVPLAMGLAAVAYPTIKVFFGESYAVGWLSLTIVSLAVAMSSGSTIVSNLLLSLGETRIILEANIVAVTIGATLCVLLVAFQGDVGAAIGRASLISVAFVYTAHRLRNKSGLHLDIEAFGKSLICSTIMALVVTLSQLLLNNAHLLPIYVATGVIIYILMLRLLKAVDKQDVQLLKEILPNRFQWFANLFAKFFSYRD